MSYWTHINGIIVVRPLGRTQPEIQYILDTVLNHLPVVCGSETSMDIYVNKKAGFNCSDSCDEYGDRTNNLVDMYGNKSFQRGWLETQNEYVITISDDFRDRMFEDTLHDFMKWVTRLGRRICIESIDIVISGYSNKSGIYKKYRIEEDSIDGYFHTLNDYLDDGPSWIDHLMWKRARNSYMPAELMYKYYEDAENDKRVENYLHIEDAPSVYGSPAR